MVLRLKKGSRSYLLPTGAHGMLGAPPAGVAPPPPGGSGAAPHCPQVAADVGCISPHPYTTQQAAHVSETDS
jgi:hypothetical protein